MKIKGEIDPLSQQHLQQNGPAHFASKVDPEIQVQRLPELSWPRTAAGD